MNDNYRIIERITGICTPDRKNTLTGANYPYHCAEPDTLLHTETGYEGTGEYLPILVDWPADVWTIKERKNA